DSGDTSATSLPSRSWDSDRCGPVIQATTLPGTTIQPKPASETNPAGTPAGLSGPEPSCPPANVADNSMPIATTAPAINTAHSRAAVPSATSRTAKPTRVPHASGSSSNNGHHPAEDSGTLANSGTAGTGPGTNPNGCTD